MNALVRAQVIFDEIHMLGQDRGPTLEVIVSRMNYMAAHLKTPVRLVGLSTALANAHDVAAWLGVEKVRASRVLEPCVAKASGSPGGPTQHARAVPALCSVRPLQLSAVGAPRAAGGAHSRLCRQALLPAHGDHEQAGLRRHQGTLAAQARDQYAVLRRRTFKLHAAAYLDRAKARHLFCQSFCAAVFVSSRRQTRLTAQELISLCGMEDNPRQVRRRRAQRPWMGGRA